MNILLVEPDQLLADVYTTAFKNDNHTVQHAAHAQQAIHHMDQNTPDVIILELQLRQHSGVEFLYEVRSYPEWSNISVIIHSMVPESQLTTTKNTLFTLGIAEYLYKPQTSLAKLLDVVSSVRQTSHP